MTNTNTEAVEMATAFEAMFDSALVIGNQNKPTSYEQRLFKKHANKIRANVPIMVVSRVELKDWGGEPGDDFIHFSRVRFTNGLRFLAGQSPQAANPTKNLVDTVIRTWNMIRQERSDVLVMFGKMADEHGVLCAPYFPEEPNQTLEFDGTIVTCTSRLEERRGEVIVRKLHVQFTKHQTERHLTHYQYVAWEKNGCPLKRGTMIWLLKQVNREEQPVVVHCPDGIGATGVFCFMEMAVQHMVDDGQLNMMQVFLMLRQRRFGAIQNDNDLKFAVQASLMYAVDMK